VEQEGLSSSGMRKRRPVAAVLAIGVACAFLLCGYEFIRSVSTSFYIDAYGAHRLPVVMGLMPVGVALTLYGYGVLLSWFGPARALLLTSGFSAALITACWAALRVGWHPAAGILYVFREAYIVLIIEQYWSLINSALTAGQAKRLNGPITGLGSLGGILGGSLVHAFATRVGSEMFLLFAAGSLIPAALLSAVAYHLAGEPQPSPEEAGGRQGHLALRLFARSRYLLLLAALIALTQVVSTALDLRFSGLVEEAFPVKDERTAYLGGFYGTLNAVAALLQFVVAPVALRWLPLPMIHLGIPLVHLVTSLLLLASPSLHTGAAAYLLFKGLDYSLFRAGKEILYIPLTFDVRYRAKEVIDAFVYRFSKGALGMLLTGVNAAIGSIPAAVFPAVAALASLIWIPVVFRLTRQPEGKR